MTTTANNSWMPAHGRRKVDIGKSLGRALKARKGTPAATKRSTIPDRDFYAFRYNFKPPSIDSTKPGTIEVKRGQDSTSVTVEHASSQAGEGHVFVGREDPAKEMDCVLIYDEQTETFTLEKLDSYMMLTYERKSTLAPGRLPASPLPLPTPSPVKQPNRDLDLEAAQLERDLLGLDEDAEGESDDEFEQILPRTISMQKQEEEEGEEEDIPIRTKPPSPAPPPIKAKRANPPVKTKISDVPPPGKSKGSGRGKGRVKKEHVAEEAEEEDLEFGQPAKAKRSRPSPPSERLALPGSSSAVQAPAAYATSFPSHSKSHQPGSRLMSPPPNAPSDSEEDWDEVAGPAPMVVDDADADGEDEEEIDINLFEAEMNQHLGEGSDDDFLAAAVSPEPEVEHAHPGGRPMSLNQFAAGKGEGSQDDDDYSSSEESDDD